MIVFVIIGVIGGLMGTLFTEINMFLARLRKRVIGKHKIKQFIEALVICLVGTIVIFFLPMIFQCIDTPEDVDIGIQYSCEKGKINPMATLFFNTQGDTIRYFFDEASSMTDRLAVTFMLVWFFSTATTYGTAIPAGLFFPGLLIGASLGEFVGRIMVAFDLLAQDSKEITVYSVVGGVAILAGYCRLSFCLAVLLMETT